MFVRNPSWREAFEWETPGQLEPQLTELESRIHVLREDHMQSMCGTATLGEKAITLEQAQDPHNEMYFDCVDCYKELTGEQPV